MSSYADVRRAACQLFDESGAARGSGFFVLADGHLVTCHHVIEGVQFPRVRVPGWTELCAAMYVEELSNPAADVAVLKIARESPCVQLGSARERIDVLAQGFRPHEQGTEPEGHTFHGRLEPGQVLHTTVERFGGVSTFVTTDGLVQGVSGGPVYDPQLRRVVGVLRAVEGGARAYIIDVKGAVPTLVERNCASVPDDALDELVRLHDVQLVSEGARPLASLADRDFHQLLSEYEVFGGRHEELMRIDRFLEEDGSGYFFVTGYAGFGKTALLAALTRRLKARGRPIAYHFITPRVDEQVEGEACLRNLCTQLLALHQLSAELRTRSLSELRALYEDLLRLPPSTEHSVVVVLDGLDEALGHWEPRADLFPTDIAEGTRVVFSARRMADREWLANLGLESLPVEQVVELGRLDAAGIHEAIESSGLQVVETAVDAVAKISEGDPFYVSDLLVELRERGGDPAGLEHLPVGHNAYLVRWWKEGRAGTDKVAFEDLMGTLAVAKGPLRADDLPEVSVEDGLTRANIDELLEKAGRYMAGDARRGYLLSHGRIFALVEDRLVERIPQYRHALLDWCRSFARKGWPHDTPPYVLAHYGDHLSDTFDSVEEADAARRDLYAVAEDPAFQRAQRRAAPDEPARGLRLLQAALRAAAEADDPVAMTRYLFLQARLIGELSGEEAVLAALDRRDPRLAAAAADHKDPARRTLLYLLIAWALVDSGDVPGARELLERLTGAGDLPRLGYWQGACAAFLMSRLYALPDLVEQLAAGVLDGDEERLNLTFGLVAAADAGVGAGAASDMMDSYFTRAWSTHVPVETTRGEGAADQLTLARTLVGAFTETYLPDATRDALVWAHLRRGDAGEALAVARTVTGDFQVQCLLKVAAHLGTTGRASSALDVFKEAWSASSNLDAQIVVCSAAKDVGIVDQGRALLSSLTEQARQVSSSDSTTYTRDYYLGRIAEALAELNDYSAAAAIAGELLNARSRDAAMLHVIRAQVAADLTDDARATVDTLELPATRARALAEIARALTGVDQDRARSTASEAARLAEVCPDDSRQSLVTAVAEALACVGLDAEARRLVGTLKNDSELATNLIAERQAERGDGQAAWHTLSVSRQRAPTEWEFASVIRRLLQRGDVEQAIGLLGRLEGQEGGGWMDLRDITGAIAACLAANGEGEAARARLITAIVREDVGGGTTDAFSTHAHALVLALLDADAVGAALTVAARIPSDGGRASALSMVLERQISGGDPTAGERTRRLAGEAVAAIASSAERVSALVTLATTEAPVHPANARKRLHEAAAIARGQSPPSGRWATLSVATSWAHLGDGDAAIHTIAAHTGIDRAEGVWTDLALALDAAQLRQSADAAFDHARAVLALSEGDDHHTYRLSNVGRMLAQSGRLDEALALAGEMPPGGHIPKLLATVASGQAEAGDARAARATLLQGQETALRLDNIERRSALVQLAKASLDAGDLPLALELASASGPSDVAEIRATHAIARGRFHEALNEVKAMNSWMTDDILKELIGHALDEGDVQTAWTAVRHLTQHYNVGYSLERIAEHAAGKGEFSTAIETASQITDEGTRSRALANTALAQARAGHGVAVRTAELIRTDQAIHLPAIAEALGEAGLKEDLKRLLEAIGRSLPAAFAMSRVLVATYPEWAQAIAEVVVHLPRLEGSRL